MSSRIYDATPCALGEGPLWHPGRNQLYWFDILRFRLHAREGDETRTWQFDEHVSAAGWIDEDHLLIASETKLFRFNLATGSSETVVPLEADRGDTRSNDGRADPWGGLWIGTMSKTAARGEGAIYRFYRGEVRKLFPGIAVPNAICFAPDGTAAYFGDSLDARVWRQRLEGAEGWPDGDPEVFIDLRDDGLTPDGSVCDADGNVWNAQWGAARIACYDPAGRFQTAVSFDAAQTSCPAFGGEGLRDLFCTSARSQLSDEALKDGRSHGATFVQEGTAQGLAEHRVIL